MLFHVTETLEQIVSHVTITEDKMDKIGKVKHVHNSMLVFNELREKHEKSDPKFLAKVKSKSMSEQVKDWLKERKDKKKKQDNPKHPSIVKLSEE